MVALMKQAKFSLTILIEVIPGKTPQRAWVTGDCRQINTHKSTNKDTYFHLVYKHRHAVTRNTADILSHTHTHHIRFVRGQPKDQTRHSQCCSEPVISGVVGCAWLNKARQMDRQQLGPEPTPPFASTPQQPCSGILRKRHVYFQSEKTAHTFMNLHIVILWQGEKERGRKNWGKNFVFLFQLRLKIYEAIPNFCCVFLCCNKMVQ